MLNEEGEFRALYFLDRVFLPLEIYVAFLLEVDCSEDLGGYDSVVSYKLLFQALQFPVEI